GGPRPGRREPVHGGSGAASMPLTPGRRPPTPPPRTIAGAAAEGPARHLPGPSPALVVVGGRVAAPRFCNSASACGVRADASQVTGSSLVAEAALFATAQQTRPGGPSDPTRSAGKKYPPRGTGGFRGRKHRDTRAERASAGPVRTRAQEDRSGDSRRWTEWSAGRASFPYGTLTCAGRPRFPSRPNGVQPAARKPDPPTLRAGPEPPPAAAPENPWLRPCRGRGNRRGPRTAPCASRAFPRG